MVRTALAAAILLAPVAPAFATGEIVCASADGSASVAIGIGRLPVLAVLRARIEVDRTLYATEAEGADVPIAVGQGAMTATTITIDFTDDAISEIVVSLRLVTVGEGDEFATGGVLSVRGSAARVVSCELG